MLISDFNSNLQLFQSLMQEMKSSNHKIAPNFRLFLICEKDDPIPTRLLHQCHKVILHPPEVSLHIKIDQITHFSFKQTIKSTIVNFTSNYLTNDVINMTSRNEWLPLLHNVSMLHGVLLLRCRFKNGWKDGKVLEENISSEQLKVFLLFL